MPRPGAFARASAAGAMGLIFMRAIHPFNSPASPGITGARLLVLPVILAAALCGTGMAAAQSPATATPRATLRKPAHHPRKRPAAAHAPSPATAVPATPAAAALPAKSSAPEAPKWPATEKPSPATVTWNSQGLRIEAANSSLVQILEDVATATGAKVEGFEADQRVFGVFGPGRARDVLSQLLQGSGYNILLIGDQGQGTPRRILLSTRKAGTAPPATLNAANAANSAQSGDEDSDTDEQPPQNPAPIRPGMQPRIQQQMQQRQPPTQPPDNPQH